MLSALSFTFVLLAILGISLTAQAAPEEYIPSQPQALLLNEDFDYGTTAMSLTIASGGNWVNHSGTSGFVGYTTTSLSMTGYGSSGVGGAATVATTGVEDVNRSFTNQTSGTVYFAALVNVSAAGTGDYFFHLKDATIGFRARVFARSVTGTLNFGLSTTSSTGTYSTTAFAYNTTYLVIAKYNVTSGDTALYVLDAVSPTEPTTPLVSLTGSGSQAVQGVAIRQGGSGARPAAIIDGVRVADTWVDVVGYVPPPEANLSVAKSGPAMANAGETITYTLDLSNTGDLTAQSTVITDILPAEVTFVTYTTALPVTFTQPSAQTLVWELGDVANGTSGTITLQGTISAGASGGTVFTNTVAASTTTTETQLANNAASAATLIPAPDLVVLKAGPASATAGETITYTISLSNMGTAVAPQTLVTDTLPAEVTFVSYTTALPVNFTQPTADTLVWELGDVAAGAGGTIEVQASISPTLSAGTQFTNTVIASTAAVESNTANNSAQITTLIGAPDLTVVKTGSASVNVGDPIAFTLTYRNVGNLDAADVVLVDQLPAAMTYVTDSLGTGVQSGNTITWTIGNLPTGASGSVVLTATAEAVGDWPNVAVISGGPVDSNLLNNTAIFTATVLGVDPFVLKSGPVRIFGGDVVSYTITYGNHGNLPVEVTITDTLPISFTTANIAYDDSGLTPIDDTNTRAWTTTIAADTEMTFTLALTVPTAIANNTRITNTVEVATTAAGDNPIDNVAQAAATVYQFTSIHDIQYVDDPDISDTSAYSGTWVTVQGVVIANPGSFLSAGGLPYRYYIEDPAGGPWSGLYIYRGTANPPGVSEGDFVRLYGLLTEFVQGGSQQTELDLSRAGAFQQIVSTGNPLPAPAVLTTDQLINAGTAEQWESVLIEFQNARVTNPNIGNGEWNFDDGSGATVGDDNAKAGGNTVFTYVPQLNDYYGFIRGIGWQSFGTYKLEPRYNADVNLDYLVTFIYHDLEDVVLVGEDVQLRGGFTNWQTNPITLTPDAGYTVFSATVTLPTTATQGYKYYAVSVGDPLAWDLLNTNDRSFAPTQGVTVKDDYRNVVVGWGNLNGPASQTINLGDPTAAIDGQLFVPNVTNPAGPGRGLRAEVGYGTAANPASWSWFATTYITNTGNNDVYAGSFTPTAGGVYSYATRYNGNWGVGNPNSAWVYADLDGIPFSLDQAGVLTVTEPRLALDKTVVTTHNPAELGEVVTYTMTLSNSGDGTATGIVLTDALPTEVTFGGFVQQNGATFGSGTVSWTGALNASAQTQIVFTATVGVNTSFLGRVVTNTVSMTAANAAGQAASAAFNIVNPPQLDIAKAVETAKAEVGLGEVVTYTLTLSNSGSGPATGVMITDVLPTAVTFGGFVQQNGAVFSSGTISWSGSLNAGAAVSIVFTATVANNPALYGTDVTNEVQFTSGNGGSGNASVAFAIVKRYFTYLPLIQR